MSYSVRDILSYIPLTKAVEAVKSGIPKVLPPEFFTLEEFVSGHQARMIEFRGTRRTARVSAYGAPAKQGDKVTLSDRAVVLLSSREQIPFREELVHILREWDSYAPQQQFALREIAFQGEQMRTRFENLEVAATIQSLATGQIYFDDDGNLLPSSSGASLVVDQGVPAGNKGQVSGIITTSWSNPAADILGNIIAFKQRVVRLTGYQLKYAIYGRNVAKYILTNEAMKYYVARNASLNEASMSSGLLPQEFLGLTWVPAYESFYEDSDGTVQPLWDDDLVVFTPEITEATWAFYRGSELVPTQFGPVADAEVGLGGLKEVFGRGRYAKILDDPVRIIDVGFSHFLPRMKVPEAFILADTTL